MARRWHEKLGDPDQDVRYAAACKLAETTRIDVREVRALIAALEDRGYGLETVPDHAGGAQDDPVPIADVAERALRKHVAGHRAVVEYALRSANERVAAVLAAVLRDGPTPPKEWRVRRGWKTR